MGLIREFISDKERQVFILKGYAGTGKTTLICCIVKYLLSLKKMPEVMAPTGRAAKVLNDKFREILQATTIHHRIYNFSGEGDVEKEGEFKKLHFSVVVGGMGERICIVDEASMISSMKSTSEIYEFGTDVLIDDILTYARPHHGGKIIFVGDPAQLPPVGDNQSVALSETFFAEKGLRVSSYCLTDVVRQGRDSCILADATMLRELLSNAERNTLVFSKRVGEVEDIDSSAIPQRYISEGCNKTAIVCFSNRQTSVYNKAIRSILFPGIEHVAPGDRLMVVRNSYQKGRVLLNGEIITVLEVSDNIITQSAPVYTERGGKTIKENISLAYRKILCQTDAGDNLSTFIIESLLENERPSLIPDEFKATYINLKIRRGKEMRMNPKSVMSTDQFFNALHVKYGYAFTCHKAQGTEWDNVIVDFTKRTGLDNDSIRWKYTAITRAKKMLYCTGLPDIQPMSNLQINPIAAAKKVCPKKLSFDDDIENSPFHDAATDPSIIRKYWSVVRNMWDDGSQYTVESVKSCPYREIYSVRTPSSDIVRVDAIYNKGGVFTRYDMAGGDERLIKYFEDEANINHHIEYAPTYESLGMLRDTMVSLCEEGGISLLSVEEADWQVNFFLKTSGCNSLVRFYYNRKGHITHAVPLSEKGENDKDLQELVTKLEAHTCQ